MIRNANNQDLKQIAILHKQCFPDYFLSKLNLEILAKYYKEFMTPNDIFLIHEHDDTINGLVLGTPISRVGRNNFIKNNLLPFTFLIIGLCIKLDKETWKRILGGIINIFSPKKYKGELAFSNEIEPSLLSICVAEKCKGSGIAKELIQEFEKKTIGAGYKGYRLKVHKNNPRAIHFYENIGMSKYEETELELILRKRFAEISQEKRCK